MTSEPYRHRTPRPVYQVIADEIAAEIKGAPADTPIPSEGDIRGRWGVARATARNAVAELRERGLIYTVPGRGSFVIGPPTAS
jgi:DNA-binding GntR family transcriptional regulator